MDQAGASTAQACVEALMRRRIAAWRPVDGGYTQALRAIAEFDDGSSAFIKASTDESTAQWLHAELNVYRAMSADFMAEMLAEGEDSEGRPILILEDLSAGTWQPAWSRALVDRVLETLSLIAACPVPEGTPSLAGQRQEIAGWHLVANDPEPLLSLDMCSGAWLLAALPTLLDAEERAELDGSHFLHLDVRSDNICFLAGRTVFVDWNWASRGNPAFDLVTWLPSLHFEGGPAPAELYHGDPGLVAMFAGYLAAHAGLPISPQLQRVREVQRNQLSVALRWVARALDLTPPQRR